ncbi:MAG: CAP domain-containing protein [Acidimicrobiales bacterium]|nr:CAP domain-containing protein [Acidimicrobiales bacterium]
MGEGIHLDGGQRGVLAVTLALVVAVALILGFTAVTGADGDDPLGVETDKGQVSTSTTLRRPATTSSTIATTTSTVDPASLPTTTAGPPTTRAATPTSRRPSTSPPRATQSAPTQPPPTQPPATAPPPPSDGPCNPGGGSAAADDIANRFCSYRASQGLPGVTRNARLDQAAAEWAQKMADDGQLSHRPKEDVERIVADACCGRHGENVGFNSEGSGAVWQSWLASSPHLANIRVGRPGEYGVGAVTQNGATWIVHLFGWH